ncbi:MAG: F0F1 ATP synthase subunit delta [Candidatus Pacebacteria bacterium]|nr:F0F1 ATP synthase subunit delta [Candidatus Paceibacterota bacterium]
MSSARAQDYAEAFTLAHREGGVSDEVLIERLFTSVKRNNDVRKLSAIAREVTLRLTRNAGGNDILVTSARELTTPQKDEFASAFGIKDSIRFAVDPKLHAGVRIGKNGEEEIDMSLARKISKLFS